MTTDTLQTVRADIVAITGDPALTTDQIGERLGQIYNHAEQSNDAQSMALVQTAWDQVQSLNVTAHAAIDTAVAARELAETVKTQRDQALEELEEVAEELGDLSNAVRNMDYAHPEVGYLIEAAEEMAWDEFCDNQDDELRNGVCRLLQSLGMERTRQVGIIRVWIDDRVIDAISGEYALTPIQKTALVSFIESLLVEDET